MRRRRIYKAHPPRMEDFTVTCPLVPGVPHLVSGSCSSPRIFGLGFLQTPPRGDALALLLAFGCANTWHGDLHPVSSVPCPAHTQKLSRAVYRGGCSAWLGGLNRISWKGFDAHTAQRPVPTTSRSNEPLLLRQPKLAILPYGQSIAHSRHGANIAVLRNDKTDTTRTMIADAHH
jgi:hypothetical protein